MFSFHIYNAISMLQYKDNIVFIISMSGEDATFLSGTSKLQPLSFRMEDYVGALLQDSQFKTC